MVANEERAGDITYLPNARRAFGGVVGGRSCVRERYLENEILKALRGQNLMMTV
jgi:hypothetical protein